MEDAISLLPSADRPSSSVTSMASIYDDLSAKSKSYVTKYEQFVLSYVLEWEKVIRGRIDAGIKKAEELRIELDHYQKKVESLRLQVNSSMAKGKSVSSAQQEKVSRNEEKLLSSKQSYNKVATDLVILLEEVTERSWRDLHPLLVKMAQFDMTISNDESKVLGNLNTVISKLKTVASDNGLSNQPRLKDLASLKPELLSTRPGGVAGLSIEAGVANYASPLSSPLDNNSPSGFPVQLTDPFSMTRSDSNPSVHSAPPPNSLMITAPAPTVEDVYGSSGLPALPMSTTNTAIRSSSFNDADSVYSGFSSQASMPGQPPPPPPSQPPPPPPSSYGAPTTSYGGGGGGFAPAPSSGGYNGLTALNSSGYGGYGAPPPPPSSGYGAPPPLNNMNAPYGSAAPPPPPPNNYANPSTSSPYGYSSSTPTSNPGYNPFGN